MTEYARQPCLCQHYRETIADGDLESEANSDRRVWQVRTNARQRGNRKRRKPHPRTDVQAISCVGAIAQAVLSGVMVNDRTSLRREHKVVAMTQRDWVDGPNRSAIRSKVESFSQSVPLTAEAVAHAWNDVRAGLANRIRGVNPQRDGVGVCSGARVKPDTKLCVGGGSGDSENQEEEEGEGVLHRECGEVRCQTSVSGFPKFVSRICGSTLFSKPTWRIVAVSAPGVAPENPPRGENGSSQEAILFQGEDRVFRARRCVAACTGEVRRDAQLVKTHDAYYEHSRKPPNCD